MTPTKVVVNLGYPLSSKTKELLGYPTVIDIDFHVPHIEHDMMSYCLKITKKLEQEHQISQYDDVYMALPGSSTAAVVMVTMIEGLINQKPKILHLVQRPDLDCYAPSRTQPVFNLENTRKTGRKYAPECQTSGCAEPAKKQDTFCQTCRDAIIKYNEEQRLKRKINQMRLGNS